MIFFVVLRGCVRFFPKRVVDFFCPERLGDFFVPRGWVNFFFSKRLDFFPREVG